jgi:RNA polymerase sigma-70 factor (ECF subfamily)
VLSAEPFAGVADGDSIARGWEALAHDHDRLSRGLRRRMIDEDAELVARAQAGDRAAFEELVRRHAGGLHAVVQRLVHDRDEAEEVTQEAFLRAWRGIGNFKGDARFFTWLYRIGVNEAWRRTSRRQRGSAGSLEEEAIDPADPRAGPDAEAELSELRVALERAVRALDRRYRTALILRDVEGLSTAEAAAIMGMNEAAFKSRLHRARLAVRNAVDEYLDHE